MVEGREGESERERGRERETTGYEPLEPTFRSIACHHAARPSNFVVQIGDPANFVVSIKSPSNCMVRIKNGSVQYSTKTS